MTATPYINLNRYFAEKFYYHTHYKEWNDAWGDCYQCPNTKLFYFIHSKCASRLYNKLMLELQWIPTDAKNVNWDSDIIVSHIRNPLIKHRKGIVEGIVQYLDVMPDLTNPKILHLLSNITAIDHHAYTIQQLLGERAFNVRWIPIDTELDHKLFTLKVFEAHGATISHNLKDWFMALPIINASTEYELELYNHLANLEVPSIISKLIDFDMCLYNEVLRTAKNTYFNQRVNQLMDIGLSRKEAIDTADSEIVSGEHKNWQV